MRSVLQKSKQMPLRLQRGVAAIEFALVFSVLFLGIYGLVTFCGVLYVQQVVSRAAEDGARAAQILGSNISTADLQANVRTAIYRSLALSAITPTAAGGTPSARETWIRARMADTPPAVNLLPAEVEIKVSYPYRANPLVPPLPLTASWMPDRLSGKATASR
ncbi:MULTISPECIES: TadE/TadG family type IV pilus assembly protein [Variovorax]|uniref:TadE/TadG family type IV pilus assembly protein n=1 Tax=Variovorax TaxID=34072 RepID=UPI0027846230|nr:TadE/TadG family type IV pilus assembly protein [Variovorax boronicumulans]MDP9914080.1 Flp pilus assembly protein TadG [Variovorax boronicumulans]